MSHTPDVAASVSLPAQAETVYVSNEKDNSVSVIDGESLKVTSTIKTGRRPRGIVLSEDMSKLYVCIGDDNRVDVIDLKTGKSLRRYRLGPWLRDVLIVGDEGVALVASRYGLYKLNYLR